MFIFRLVKLKSNRLFFCDCAFRALLEFMTAPSECLQRRVYNVTAMSFTPEELVDKLYKYVPQLHVTYKPDSRQNIGILLFLFLFSYSCGENNFIELFLSFTADSWPQVFDDSEARKDWKWKPKYDLDKLVELMVNDVCENHIGK